MKRKTIIEIEDLSETLREKDEFDMTCSVCYGRGWIPCRYSSENKECPRCHGRKMVKVRVTIEYNVE